MVVLCPYTARERGQNRVMISQTEFKDQAMTTSKQAMPEVTKFDGPAGLESSGAQNKFSANSTTPLPKPGFNS